MSDINSLDDAIKYMLSFPRPKLNWEYQTLTDIKSLDDAVAYLRKRMEQAKTRNREAINITSEYYSQGQYDAFGEAIEAITGKSAGDVS